MKKINIFSDPHLGTTRKAHTTAKSSERLTQALFAAAAGAIDSKADANVIVGDLFDKTYNPEYVIQQGVIIGRSCITLAGNHDETNRAETKSSIDIVAEIGDVIQTALGAPSCITRGPLYFVPHHGTQELFLEALISAKRQAEYADGKKYLFVHCNRGELPGPQSDSTLVLEIEEERELLQYFDKIFYGHIHQPAWYKDGLKVTDVNDANVIVCGNTHPTSFGDISNKYSYTLDTETGELKSRLIWSVQDSYRELEVGQPISLDYGVTFVRVYGKGTKLDVANYVQEVWEAGAKALLAVRPDVEYIDIDTAEVEDINLDDLSSVISKELAGTELAALFANLLGELQ